MHGPSRPVPESFYAAPDKCVACGMCVDDCPAAIIAIDDGVAAVKPEDMENCLGCQHCLAICPTGAVEVAGRRPGSSRPLSPPDPQSLDLLVRGRRSVRKFSPHPVERELFDRVLETAAHAPTGVNSRDRLFTAILDSGVMAEYRDRACRALVAGSDRMPEELSWLVSAASKWLDKGRDVIFRNAPHLIVVTSGPGASTGEADCLIALSYFDLIAQANGIGTVWCGMADYMLRHLPETRRWLGIPDDHAMGYAMLFGMPDVFYARTAQYGPESVSVIERLVD